MTEVKYDIILSILHSEVCFLPEVVGAHAGGAGIATAMKDN